MFLLTVKQMGLDYVFTFKFRDEGWIKMHKLIVNPAYVMVLGKPTCNHKREVIRIGKTIYEFCDICGKVFVRPANGRLNQ